MEPQSTMPTVTEIAILALAFLAAVFALFSLLGGRKARSSALNATDVENMIRSEADRQREDGEQRAQLLRQEITSTIFGFQASLGDQIRDFGARLESGLRDISGHVLNIGKKTDEDIRKMGEDAQRNRDGLRVTIEAKLDGASNNLARNVVEFRDSLSRSFSTLETSVADSLRVNSQHQRERLDNVGVAIGALTEKHERAQESLRQSVEGRLDALRNENSVKLDEMRQTVDEKLQSTLDARLGESFSRVVEHLERVHKGIGEMQVLAAGVGDLKRILSNVRTRGAFGEVQLESLLDQFLSPEQYIRNAQTKKDSQERVEFAIRFPGRRDESGEFLLPVDAKFPVEDYERLLSASERNDVEAVSIASRALEARVKSFAKSISDKYLNPPLTADFAILFLPTEGLYAEVLRRPGLLEAVQREYHVTLTGPSTFTAYLIALQMGFRTLAIEKRSGDVWKILGAIRGEFAKYNGVVDKIARQLHSTTNTIADLGTRTRAMNRKLREVETLPPDMSARLLGLQPEDLRQEELEEGEAEQTYSAADEVPGFDK